MQDTVNEGYGPEAFIRHTVTCSDCVDGYNDDGTICNVCFGTCEVYNFDKNAWKMTWGLDKGRKVSK